VNRAGRRKEGNHRWRVDIENYEKMQDWLRRPSEQSRPPLSYVMERCGDVLSEFEEMRVSGVVAYSLHTSGYRSSARPTDVIRNSIELLSERVYDYYGTVRYHLLFSSDVSSTDPSGARPLHSSFGFLLQPCFILRLFSPRSFFRMG